MSDDEFEARLIKWLDAGEGDPYPYYANPYPAEPQDAGSMPCAPCILRRMSCSGRRYRLFRPESPGLSHRRLDRIPQAPGTTSPT